jgi:hypothetical protein
MMGTADRQQYQRRAGADQAAERTSGQSNEKQNRKSEHGRTFSTARGVPPEILQAFVRSDDRTSSEGAVASLGPVTLARRNPRRYRFRP